MPFSFMCTLLSILARRNAPGIPVTTKSFPSFYTAGELASSLVVCSLGDILSPYPLAFIDPSRFFNEDMVSCFCLHVTFLASRARNWFNYFSRVFFSFLPSFLIAFMLICVTITWACGLRCLMLVDCCPSYFRLNLHLVHTGLGLRL